MWRLMSLAASAALVAGCATNPAPVPLVADTEGKRLIEGEWVGEYFSPATGRAGSILFSFVPHDSVCGLCGSPETHAHGDVLMLPREFHDVMRPADGEYHASETGPHPQVLRIEAVRVTGNRITGTVETYQDPDTGFPLSSSFEGTIAGSRITGDLVTVNGRTGERYVGTWKVERKK